MEILWEILNARPNFFVVLGVGIISCVLYYFRHYVMEGKKEVCPNSKCNKPNKPGTLYCSGCGKNMWSAGIKPQNVMGAGIPILPNRLGSVLFGTFMMAVTALVLAALTTIS